MQKFLINDFVFTVFMCATQVYPYLYFRPHSITNTFFEDASPEQMS